MQHLTQILTTSLNMKFLDADHECFKYAELARFFETASDTRRAVALLRNTTDELTSDLGRLGM